MSGAIEADTERVLPRTGYIPTNEPTSLRAQGVTMGLEFHYQPKAKFAANIAKLPELLKRRAQNRSRLRLRGLQSRVSDSAMIDKPGRRFAPPWSVEETHARRPRC